MTKALPCIEPRLLSREGAATYAGCESLSTFSDWVRRGILPGPVPGTHRWDRRAIDAALDRLSGLADAKPLDDYERWKQEYAGGQA